jgi:hypothetical protein
MELPLARLGHCPQCGLQFLICSRCDRGQRYCGPVCAQAARRASLRAAGKRYQAGRPGRRTHAARQRRYRARLAKVTHQGSPPPAPDGAMPPGLMVGRVATPPPPAPRAGATLTQDVTPSPPTRCRFCGQPCAPWVRQGFLRHRRAPRTIVVTALRGTEHGHSP